MPIIPAEQMEKLLKEIIRASTPVTLNISNQNEEKALKACDEYIENANKNINDMNPLSVYYIISKLPEDKQILFFRENIKYIQEHDEEVFLYSMLAPPSLSYFLSLKVLQELNKLDKDLFKKILNGSLENLFYGFSHQDYLDFYNDFDKDILEMKNMAFINAIHYHNRCCYDDILNSDDIFERQRVYNKEFMDLLLKKYIEKINKFKPMELLSFINYIEDIEVYREFINHYYDKLNIAFNNIDEYDLNEYLSETNAVKQEILISSFFENIIKKQNIKKIVYKINPNIIIDLYNKNKEIFKVLTLNDWLKVCSKQRAYNEDFKRILDTFEIDNIEELFDTKFYISDWCREPVSALRYVETKYRNNLPTNGILEEIDETISIFSEKYFRNLNEFKIMFKNKIISKNDKNYKQHLANFILFLKNQNIINNIENNNFKEIEGLFYRIVMGKSITLLYELSSIEEITIFNRIGNVDFDVKDFTVEQLENYNVKQHKQLYKQFEENDWHIRDYKKLSLKLIFMVGFNHAKSLLEIDDMLPVLEHLVGNVDVKNIMLNEQGNPILNSKIMNLLFNDKSYSKIKEMLSNKDNDLYKYFPRIFSEWEMIKINGKDKTLNTIIDFLKTDEISVPPQYHRLNGLFKYIGCSNSIVKETFNLHDQMLKRTESSIPRIIGKEDEYSYEILKLDDMEGLTVGNKTDCCFTVLGNGYSCLKHAVTSKNGRILVIKKNNEILAHSWLWRNGDLLCLDNIEISKTINQVDFFSVYLKLADEIMKKSLKKEGLDSCIKNITIGFTNFDKKVNGIENYPCLISKTCNLKEKNFGDRLGQNRKFVDVLPQPLEEVGYSDSKNVQYLIRGNGRFNLGQSNFFYQDDRKEIMHYASDSIYEEDYLKRINKQINALRYLKAERDNSLELYKLIDVDNLQEAYCNSDWYVISYKSGDLETFNVSLDPRSNNEIKSLPLKSVKTLKKAL